MNTTMIVYLGNNLHIINQLKLNAQEYKIDFRILETLDHLETTFSPELNFIFADQSHPHFNDQLKNLSRLKENSCEKTFINIAILTKTPKKSDVYLLGCGVDFLFVQHNFNDTYIKDFFNFYFDSTLSLNLGRHASKIENINFLEFIEIKSISNNRVNFTSKTRISDPIDFYLPKLKTSKKFNVTIEYEDEKNSKFGHSFKVDDPEELKSIIEASKEDFRENSSDIYFINIDLNNSDQNFSEFRFHSFENIKKAESNFLSDRPQVIFVRLDNENNSIIGLYDLIQLFNHTNQPILILLNPPSSTESIKKVLEYDFILCTGQQITHRNIEEFIKIYKFKKNISRSNEFKFKENSLSKIAFIKRELDVIEFNPEKFYIEIKNKQPMLNVYYLQGKQNNFATVVNYSDKNGVISSRSFIHGFSL